MPADTSAPLTGGPARSGGGATSVIHDLGYRRYDGPRLGRAQIIRALAWHSFRAAFGLGRGAKAKIVPLVALVALCLPAVVNAFAMSRGNPRVVDYDTYTPALRDLVMTVFVAVQAPELVSRDLRSRVLPLYFARPIKTIDYPLAKYLAFTGACLVMLEVPLLLLYAGSIANVHGGSAVWGADPGADPGPAGRPDVGGRAGRDQPVPGQPDRPPGLRHRRGGDRLPAHLHPGRDPAPGRGPATETSGPQAGGSTCRACADKVSGLFSPFTLFDGVRMWLGGTDPADSVPNPGGLGAVYALVLVVITALCLYGLAARYRKARLS